MTRTAELLKPQAAVDFYEDRYQHGYMDSWPLEKQQRIAEFIRMLPLPPTGSALDFGCGTGVFTRVLRGALPGWRIAGTEISANALAIARKFSDDIEYVGPGDPALDRGGFDLVFSHHVLEHVADLPSTADLIASLIRPGGAMLHVLPCGNRNSLEWRLCRLHRHGFDPSLGNRFFFEDEGHVRRLTSDQLCAAWQAHGFVPVAASFANHFAGAVKYYSGETFERAMSVVRSEDAVNQAAGWILRIAKAALSVCWLARQPWAVLNRKRATGIRSARDLALVIGCLPCAPLSFAADRLIDAAADREWRSRRGDPSGSEMYVALRRL
jgi:SAM-dependent methyltransferase